ncbi:PaaI family thioesterase [Citricoccus zhacaiensis]
METGPWVLDQDGRPTGIAAAVILDGALSSAIRAAVPDWKWPVTTELHLNLLRPLPSDGTVLEAWTRSEIIDNAGGLTSGDLRTPDGTVHVQATAWFHGHGQADDSNLEQSLRSAERPLGPNTELPLAQLLHARDETAARSAIRSADLEQALPGLAFDSHDDLVSPLGAIHGGALTMMAGLAAQHTLLDRLDVDLQSLRVTFLRAGSGTVFTQARTIHSGRTLRVVEVNLYGERGPEKPFAHCEAVFRPRR